MLNLVPIQSTGTVLRPGLALPWNVHDESGVLLLARGAVIETEAALGQLKSRNLFADTIELILEKEFKPRPADNFFDRFYSLELRLQQVLRTQHPEEFVSKLRAIAWTLDEMVENQADPLLFTIFKNDEVRLKNYGVTHSLDVAAVSAILSKKLGMEPSMRESLLFAALTMNISSSDLQTKLSRCGGRMSEEQRQEIAEHPVKSAAILKDLGVKDALWLEAVEQHHEVPGGVGYPKNLFEPSYLSQVLRLVDIFLAKHAPRGTRVGLPAKRAAQELYLANRHLSEACLLIKEIGIYPPGCYVRLVNGEIGVVVRRGKSALTPLVTLLIGSNGMPATRLVRKDTSIPCHAIVATVPSKSVKLSVPVTKLYDRKEL